MVTTYVDTTSAERQARYRARRNRALEEVGELRAQMAVLLADYMELDAELTRIRAILEWDGYDLAKAAAKYDKKNPR